MEIHMDFLWKFSNRQKHFHYYTATAPQKS